MGRLGGGVPGDLGSGRGILTLYSRHLPKRGASCEGVGGTPMGVTLWENKGFQWDTLGRHRPQWVPIGSPRAPMGPHNTHLMVDSIGALITTRRASKPCRYDPLKSLKQMERDLSETSVRGGISSERSGSYPYAPYPYSNRG